MTENSGKIIAVPNPTVVNPFGIPAQAIMLKDGGEITVFGEGGARIVGQEPAGIKKGVLLLAIPEPFSYQLAKELGGKVT